jgi:hypothetical protein
MPTLLQDLPLAFTLPDSNLWEMLAIPLGALVMVAAILWTGRIRQRLLVNVLALGVMMPLVHLCMITAGAHLLSQRLQLVLLDVMPTWLG